MSDWSYGPGVADLLGSDWHPCVTCLASFVYHCLSQVSSLLRIVLVCHHLLLLCQASGGCATSCDGHLHGTFYPIMDYLYIVIISTIVLTIQPVSAGAPLDSIQFYY